MRNKNDYSLYNDGRSISIFCGRTHTRMKKMRMIVVVLVVFFSCCSGCMRTLEIDMEKTLKREIHQKIFEEMG